MSDHTKFVQSESESKFSFKSTFSLLLTTYELRQSAF